MNQSSMPSPQDREAALFALALEKAGADRAAFLQAVCGGDDSLHKRLEALLAAHGIEDTLLGNSASANQVGPEIPIDARQAATIKLEFPNEPSDEALGQSIGRYKLLEKIGEGGMGLVYMAEQAEPVRRRVALKLIKLGMDTREVVGRFEAERQALAMMDHPCIARVFDGGATETGRPYFVMELVRGVPVTEYCEQHRLSIRDRLELFIRICVAVQHAHQKGIVHRDLKPSNVLVAEIDGRPHPKIIDFGVAKAIAARLTEKTVFTQFHQVIGTPAYMSPEQAGANREDVDTRSDIYSLGVLLYELLSGRTPFDAKKLLAEGYDAILRTIREQEPPKLSTRLSTLTVQELGEVAARRRATPERLSRLLRGELDWVVMKALEKERVRRYATAAEFAGDLERYLKSEPVAAAPPSVVYRARRFVARNRVAVSFASLVAGLLLTTTVLAIRSALVEGRQRREVAVQRDFATNQAALARVATEEAQRTLGELSETLSQLELQKVAQLLEPGPSGVADIGLAVAHLARSLRQNPSDFRAAYRLISLLMQRNFARPVSERRFDAKILDLAWAGRGLLLATTPTNEVTDASGSPVNLVDFDSGRRVLGPILEGASITRFTFSSSGRRFWVARNQGGSTRQQIVVGDVATGRAAGPAVIIEGWAGRVVFDESEDRMIIQSQRRLSPGREQRLEVFDIRSGRALGQPYDSPGPSYGAATFAAEGNRLIIPGSGFNAATRLYDFERGVLEELPPPGTRRVLAVAGNQRERGRDLIPYFGSEGVTPPGLFGGAPVIVPISDPQNGGGQFSHDGRQLAVVESDSHTVQIWSLAPTRALPIPLLRGDGAARQYASPAGEMDPGGRRLAEVVGTNVFVWDLRRGRVLTSFSPSGMEIQRVRLSPDAELVLAISEGRARLFSASDGRSRGQEWGAATNGDWRLVSGAFSPDARRVLTWTTRGEGRVWLVNTLMSVGTFGPHGADGVSVALSSDGRRVVTYGGGNSARVWDLANGREVCPPLEHLDRINSAQFTPDGETLVTASNDGTARVWNLRTGSPLTPQLKHGAPVFKAVVLAHVARIATAGEGREVKLWDLRSGNLLRTVEMDRDAQSALVGAADGRLLFNVSYQSRVFDPATLVPLSETMMTTSSGVGAGRVSRDGSLLVAHHGVGMVLTSLPVVREPAPPWLPDLAEAMVARRLTTQGVAEKISFAEAQRVFERLRTQTGDDPFTQWARWQLASGPERAVNPGVEFTPADYARLAIASRDTDTIRSALELEPDSVALLEALAGHLGVSLLPRDRQGQFGHPDQHLQFLASQSSYGVAVAERLLELSPQSASGWRLKAVAHASLQDTNRALEALTHVISAPTTPNEWVMRAFVLETAGRIDEAEAAHTQAGIAHRRESETHILGGILEARLSFLRRHGRKEEALREQLAARGITPRDPATDPRLLDLGSYYTGSLTKPSQFDAEYDDLAEVPAGVHAFASVPFDVRGTVDRPTAGIVVQRAAQRLHFLQGAKSLWLGPTNERPVAVFVVHYADGQRVDIPVIGGRHVRDWFILPDEPISASEAEVAWIGTNARSRLQAMRLRLFKMTWENPRPDVPIAKLDLDMQSYGEGLFLLAVTADDGTLPSATPLDLIVRAEIAEATGRAEQALPLIETALIGQPNESRLIALKARLLAVLHREAEAVDLLTVLISRLDATKPAGIAERRSLLRLRSGWLKKLGRDAEALADSLAWIGIPLRDPSAPAELLDLSPFYNAALIGSWHPGRASNDLAALPPGVQTFNGVRFDVRGVVQLAGTNALNEFFPTLRTNLAVNRSFQRLHALHATGWTETPGTKIASLRLHFADGRQHELPIVFGDDVRDWNSGSDPTEPSLGKVVWRGHNGAGFDIRLFHSTWKNPFPGVAVRAVDYVTAGTQCAPFLVALTTE